LLGIKREACCPPSRSHSFRGSESVSSTDMELLTGSKNFLPGVPKCSVEGAADEVCSGELLFVVSAVAGLCELFAEE
jgi:hypothetical protein